MTSTQPIASQQWPDGLGIGSTAAVTRALNKAIHIITLTRMRCRPTTKQYRLRYSARRTAVDQLAPGPHNSPRSDRD